MKGATDSSLLPPQGTLARKWALVLMALGPLLFGALGLCLGQDVNWDFRNYHWYNVYAFMNGRDTVDFLPSQAQFFINPLLDVPFYLLVTHLPLRLAYFILGSLQGLNFSLLFVLGWLLLDIGRPGVKTVACAALAALGMLGGMGIAELGAVFGDNLVSLGILSSMVLAIRWQPWLLGRDGKAAMMAAFLAGIPAGAAAGLKLTCASFCAGLCFAFWPASGRRRGFLLSGGFGLGVLAGAAATYGYWGWFLYTHYGSPTFPWFNALFRSPLLPPENIIDHVVPDSSGVQLAFPFLFYLNPYLVSETWFRDLRIPILYVLLPMVGVLALAGRTATLDWRTKLAFWMAALGYGAWLSIQTVYRYLLPLEMLAPLLVALCILAFPMTVRRKLVLGALIFCAIALSIRPVMDFGRRLSWSEHVVEVAYPPLKKDTMLVMAGYEAYSYLLTEFPPDVTALRIQSRAFHPEYGWLLNDLIRARLDAHKGSLLLFVPQGERDNAERALPYFDLRLAPQTCRIVTDRLYEPEAKPYLTTLPHLYDLCALERKKTRAGLPFRRPAASP